MEFNTDNFDLDFNEDTNEDPDSLPDFFQLMNNYFFGKGDGLGCPLFFSYLPCAL